MKYLKLVQVEHNVQIGDACGNIQPNITEDAIFTYNNEIVGFFIKKISPELKQYADIANAEFLSDRVPKSTMKRSSGLFNKENEVLQFSTIIGAIPPKPHMRRNYKTLSSVHSKPTAQTFIKAMKLAVYEAEEIIKKIAPEIFEKQKNLIESLVEPKYRFGRLFTSSISNFNIAANYHRDAGNIQHCVNVIITKRKNSVGGNLNVPDYNATMDSCDDSMLVYPAWRNVHGVTPIIPTKKGGYRNSLVFYPLKAFKPKD